MENQNDHTAAPGRNALNGDQDRRTKDHGVLWTDQTVGTIVQRKHTVLVQDITELQRDDLKYVVSVTTAYGMELFLTKLRWFVIIGRTGRRICEAPILSHPDRSPLEGKDKDTLEEYISLMPPGADPKTFKNQVEENPVVRIQATTNEDELAREHQVIQMTAFEYRDVDCDELRIGGNVFKEDVDGMWSVARRLIGFKPPADKTL